MTKKPNAMMVAHKWKEIMAKRKEQEKLLLEVMRHPDATPEHLAAVREAYMHTTAQIEKYRPRVSQILLHAGYKMP